MTSEHERVHATPDNAVTQTHDHVLVVDGDEQFAADTVGAVLALGLTASSAGSVSEAIAAAEGDPPTLLVVEIDAGGGLAGLRLADTFRDRWGSSVVLMTTRTDRETVAAVAAVGASGVLCKPFHWRQFEMTVRLALDARAVSHDGPPAPRDPTLHFEASRADLEVALRRIAAEISRVGFSNLLPEYTPNHEWLAMMRPREREVVTLLLQHQRVPAIARTLAISPATVRNHLKSVFRQMGVHSQQELLLLLQQRSPQAPDVSDRLATSET